MGGTIWGNMEANRGGRLLGKREDDGKLSIGEGKKKKEKKSTTDKQRGDRRCKRGGEKTVDKKKRNRD